MTLEDTIGLMCSDSAWDRLKGEYLQLVIRLDRLEKYLDGLEDKATSEAQTMRAQRNSMKYYRDALRNRMLAAGYDAKSLDELIKEE